MLKCKLILVSLFFLSCFHTNAQTAKKIDIQQIEVIDPQIEGQLKTYLDSLEKTSDYWASGKGYLLIYLREPDSTNHNDNPIVRLYDVYPAVVDFDNASDNRFPMLYTFLAGKICLLSSSETTIEDFLRYEISNKSKKRFMRSLEPFLPVPKKREKEITEQLGKPPRGDRFYRDIPFVYLHTLHLEVAVYLDGSTQSKQLKSDN